MQDERRVEMTLDEWTETATETTTVETPEAAQFPERFRRNGMLYERVTFDLDVDGNVVAAVFYSDEAGRCLKVWDRG